MSHSVPPERAIPGNHIAVDGETAAKQQHPAVTPTPKTAVVLRAVRRWVASRAFRWRFVAVTVALGGYAVAAQWGQVSRSLDRMGPLTVALALISVLLGALMSMQVWRALLASLGSPLPVPGTARIPFTGTSSYLWAFAVTPVLLACLHPRVLNKLMSRLLGLARQPPLEHSLRRVM